MPEMFSLQENKNPAFKDQSHSQKVVVRKEKEKVEVEERKIQLLPQQMK